MCHTDVSTPITNAMEPAGAVGLDRAIDAAGLRVGGAGILMKTRTWTSLALALGLFAAGFLIFHSARAQPKTQPTSQASHTDWLGALVVGRQDTGDRIAPGLHPDCEGQVQIGLRSDGVVVWRRATPK